MQKFLLNSTFRQSLQMPFACSGINGYKYHIIMDVNKVLFLSQEIAPYLPDSQLATIGHDLPMGIQERGMEVRTFMPKYGSINQRRNQLHEVIRLSGMNLRIDDTDHPLIIKVATMLPARMQVYFIYNDDYFQRNIVKELETISSPDDNDERSIFFIRGALETVKKLRWEPDVIHCQGWMSALVPLYIKKAYNEELGLDNVKVVTSLFDQPQQEAMAENTKNCIAFNEGEARELLTKYNDAMTSRELEKIAIDYSDGVIKTSANIDDDIMKYAEEAGVKILDCQDSNFAQSYIEFYEKL